MAQTSLAPPEVWRHLLRATLRECSYLPDPIAKDYMRKYVLERYRKKLVKFSSVGPKIKEPECRSGKHRERVNAASLKRQKTLHKSAKRLLSILQRASQGYQTPLEKILMLSYGRIGPKRYKLLSTLLQESQDTITPNKVLTSSTEVQEFLKESAKERFGDEWKLPEVLQALVRSQKNNSIAKTALGRRFKLTKATLDIPVLNSWHKPMPDVRRKNIRKRLLNHVKFGTLPPPDAADLDTLRGLILGTEPWQPPVRRAKASLTQSLSEGSYLETLLLSGPQQGTSFKSSFRLGRPHRLTRRFMRTFWEKIFNMLPQQATSHKGQPKFEFPSERRKRPLIMSVRAESFNRLFENADQNIVSTSSDEHKQLPVHNI